MVIKYLRKERMLRGHGYVEFSLMTIFKIRIIFGLDKTMESDKRLKMWLN
jgi:hypothetical protein